MELSAEQLFWIGVLFVGALALGSLSAISLRTKNPAFALVGIGIVIALIPFSIFLNDEMSPQGSYTFPAVHRVSAAAQLNVAPYLLPATCSSLAAMAA